MTLNSDAAQVFGFKAKVQALSDACQAIISDPSSASETELVSLAKEIKQALADPLDRLAAVNQALQDEGQRNPTA